MKYFGNGLSELHKELNTIIRKADKLEEAKTLFFELHSKLHVSSMTGAEQNETDSLLGDLMPSEYRIMPTSKDETIHVILHLHDCGKWKQHIRDNKKCFRRA